jgi:4'-phosphopantetheinyl transferase
MKLRGCPNEIHVYHARFAALRPYALPLSANLSTEERDRAARYRSALHDRFVLSHGLLRAVLARYTSASAALEIAREPCGRPYLVSRDVEFNLSHTSETVAIAVGRHRLGVDIEALSQHRLLSSIRDQFLSPGERRALDGIPAADRPLAIVRAWVRKEAVLKAIGCGLAGDLSAIDVFRSSGEQGRSLEMISSVAGYLVVDRTLRSDVIAVASRDHNARLQECDVASLGTVF